MLFVASDQFGILLLIDLECLLVHLLVCFEEVGKVGASFGPEELLFRLERLLGLGESLFFLGVFYFCQIEYHFGLVEYLVHFSVTHVEGVQFLAALTEYVELVVHSEAGVEDGSHEVIVTGRPETLSSTGTLALTIRAFHLFQVPDIDVPVQVPESCQEDQV